MSWPGPLPSRTGPLTAKPRAAWKRIEPRLPGDLVATPLAARAPAEEAVTQVPRQAGVPARGVPAGRLVPSRVAPAEQPSL